MTREEILAAIRGALKGAGLTSGRGGNREALSYRDRLTAAINNIAQSWLADIEFARSRAGIPTEVCAVLQHASSVGYNVFIRRPHDPPVWILAFTPQGTMPIEGAVAVHAVTGRIELTRGIGTKLVREVLGPDTPITTVLP